MTESAEDGAAVPEPPRSLWLDGAPPIPTDEALPDSTDVLVVGAGLTGVVTALLLARGGRRVAVAEARTVGAGTTGHTTGKLTVLQGTVVGQIRALGGVAAARAYVDANRAGQDWLVAELGGDPRLIQPCTAYTYAQTAEGLSALRREHTAMTDAAADGVQFLDEAGMRTLLPFAVSGALALSGQWQLHPQRVLALLVQRLRHAGGIVVPHCRMYDIEPEEHGLTVSTEHGAVRCRHLVLATGTPATRRGLLFAQLTPSRSLVGAYDLAAATPPDGAFVAAETSGYSLRVAPATTDRPVLLVGSPGFRVGEGSTADVLTRLDAQVKTWYPSARRLVWWGAQDYRSASGVPFADVVPDCGDRVWAATGYDKWGMTNAVAAAQRISAAMLDAPTPAAPSTGALHTLGAAIQANAGVAGRLVRDWVRSETRTAGAGDTGVGRRGLQAVASSTVDGRTCTLSAVCTHLGGIVSWNDAERSWDCPLHGSRFAADGAVLEGPAVRPLQPLDDPHG